MRLKGNSNDGYKSRRGYVPSVLKVYEAASNTDGRFCMLAEDVDEVFQSMNFVLDSAHQNPPE